jgi:hypothetical protein
MKVKLNKRNIYEEIFQKTVCCAGLSGIDRLPYSREKGYAVLYSGGLHP